MKDDVRVNVLASAARKFEGNDRATSPVYLWRVWWIGLEGLQLTRRGAQVPFGRVPLVSLKETGVGGIIDIVIKPAAPTHL